MRTLYLVTVQGRTFTFAHCAGALRASAQAQEACQHVTVRRKSKPHHRFIRGRYAK